jgi:hypothetical protein
VRRLWPAYGTAENHDVGRRRAADGDFLSVHLGLHAALGGAWRLRWLNDLNLVITHESIDWSAVLFRARQWRASHLLGVALVVLPPS